MAGTDTDLRINPAALPETLAALRGWYAAYQQHAAVAFPAELGPVYAACQRLFAPPEPAPDLRKYWCRVPGCRDTEVGCWSFRIGGRLVLRDLCRQHGEWLEALLT